MKYTCVMGIITWKSLKSENFENMVMERGMNNIVSAFKKIAVRIEDNILNPDMWNRLPFCSFYDELCSLIETGET